MQSAVMSNEHRPFAAGGAGRPARRERAAQRCQAAVGAPERIRGTGLRRGLRGE